MKRQQLTKGFSLIELMITVAIIAILAAIAYPSYQNHVTKTRRGAAAACLMEAAQFMERYYTTNLTYAGAAVPQGLLQCQSEIADHYTIGLAAEATATQFSLQAVPSTGQAARDSECGTLSINQAGTKGETGEASSASACW